MNKIIKNEKEKKKRQSLNNNYMLSRRASQPIQLEEKLIKAEITETTTTTSTHNVVCMH